MKNQVYANQRPGISLPVPAGTKSGDPVKVGSLMGVAATDRADSTVTPPTIDSIAANSSGNADGYASVLVDGGYLLTVTGAVSSAGTAIYIDSDGALTTTATSNTLFGYTVPGPDNAYLTKTADAGPAVVQVKAQV